MRWLSSVKIMNFTCLDKPVRSALRRNVALGSAEKFVNDHKLLNRGGTQEGRKIVRMEVPLVVGAAIGGLLVETHGVRESSLEQIIVANGDAAQDVAEEIPLARAELIDGSEMALAQDQRFVWPNSPEGHDDGKCVVLADDPHIYLKLELQLNVRVVCQNDAFAVVVPFWAVWPFESLVLSKRHLASIDQL